MTAIAIASAAVGALGMLALWVASVRLRDASIVDVFWGPGFAAIAWTSVAVAGASPRGVLVAALASVWGARLAAHLARRRRGQGEDRRYAAMRAAHGERFALVSLFTVFLLQAGLMWIVSLPLQAAAAAGSEPPLGALDAAGVALFAIGLAFEAIADAQLARFLADPAGRGRVMQEGLWRYSRHPNYFGDFLVWWGLGAIGLAAGGWWALAGPALMSVLLLRVSGVTLLERTIGERRPEYRAYAARTSAFFPWPPRRDPGPPRAGMAPTPRPPYERGMATIGFIGAGHIGGQLARLAVANGHDVVLSNSRGPETLAALVKELGPRARAGTPADAARAGDLVVVTIPLKAYRSVPVEPLAGKVVVDTNNYYPQRDGRIRELDEETTTTAELLQAHLPRSKVVKAFNHIHAADLTTQGQPPGTPNRRALAIAGDDADAKATVSRLIDAFGFDVVDLGPLREGWRIQRDTPGYGPRRTADELRRDAAAAKRYREM